MRPDASILARSSRAARIVLALVSAHLLSCHADDVVVADAPDAAPSSMPPAGMPCQMNSECPASAYCHRDMCNQMVGHCKPWPLMCEPRYEPVCGCDGVTYWNDCLREQRGVSASVPAQCLQPKPCGTPDDTCPEGAYCAHLLRADAPCDMHGMGMGLMIPGECWVVPITCDKDTLGPYWSSCGPPTCMSTCDAIKTEQPFRMSFDPCP